MKLAVLYYSKSGHTREMAEKIVEGMRQAEGAQARAFAIDQADAQWIEECDCVVIGTPTYYADVAGELKLFLEKLGIYQLAGKLGGAFATAGYVHGGADIAIQSILTHLMFFGMMVYSGGCACGNPPIHLGPVLVNGMEDEAAAVFCEYGRRMAAQAQRLFH